MVKDWQISQYLSFVCSFVSVKNVWSCMGWGGDRRAKQNDNAGSHRVTTLRDFLERLWYRQSNPLLWVLPHRVPGNKCFPDPLLVPYLSLSKREGGYFCYGWIRVQATPGQEVSAANQAPVNGDVENKFQYIKCWKGNYLRYRPTSTIGIYGKVESLDLIFFEWHESNWVSLILAVDAVPPMDTLVYHVLIFNPDAMSAALVLLMARSYAVLLYDGWERCYSNDRGMRKVVEGYVLCQWHSARVHVGAAVLHTYKCNVFVWLTC